MIRLTTTILLLLGLLFSFPALAHHVKGGWIGYKYMGNGIALNSSRYEVTVYLYIDCHNVESYTASVILGAFDAGTGTSMKVQEIKTDGSNIMRKGTFSPCVVDKPDVCYNVYTYTTTLELPNNQKGYDLNVQFRARVDNIVNIVNSQTTGITLFAKIPGKIVDNGQEIDYHINSSPQFNFLDTSVICHSSKISIPFSATDPDGDSLSYSFGPGNDAGGRSNEVLVPPSPPPYLLLVYRSPYNGLNPLGNGVTINPNTGLITGRAPDQIGEYVVAVYVQEWRKGVLISTSKKEIQVNVTGCSIQSAILNPSYINCKDYSFDFKNNTTTTGATYLWDFGVPSAVNNTSTSPTPTFVYPDTGTYTLKLKVGVSEECTDSTTSEIKVYPGFFPAFDMKGQCILAPSKFTDQTTTKNGTVNGWLWDFGNDVTSNDRNPTYQYTQPGDYKVSLLVTNSKGCSDTVSHLFTVFNSLGLKAAFSDTLICYKDSVQLLVSSPFVNSYQWTSSDPNILNANTNSPIVFPKNNTEYTITAQNEACTENIKVKVNLLMEVNLIAEDLYLCTGDSAIFHVTSLATRYNWTAATNENPLNNYTIKQPSFLVNGDDNYHVKAWYGNNCMTEKDIKVFTAPYPKLKILNNDTTICVGNSIELQAVGNATDNIWIPTNQQGTNITVRPNQKSSYIIDGYDRNSYCSKHVQDTVVVNITPKFNILFPRDTTIVLNQPLTLKPSTNQIGRNYNYLWSPSSYLSNTDSAIVLAHIPKGVTQQFYTLQMRDQYGCEAAAQIAIHIFQTATDIFVPSAFTPNGDGKNDIIRPILVGIKRFDYFRIYNRWGQLIYSTQNQGQGWDGNVNGKPQPNDTFVYQVSGIDYNNKKIEKSGTVVLIR